MGNRLVKMDATASGTVTTNSTFDLANRLTAVNGSSYTNDANGNTLPSMGQSVQPSIAVFLGNIFRTSPQVQFR